MKRIFILAALSLFYNCAQSRIADGESTISGNDADKRLRAAAAKIDSYYYGAIKRPDLSANNMFNSIFIHPIQINYNKVYDKASVDDCVDKINSIAGFLIGGNTIQIQCKILDAGVIDIGGLKIGNNEAKKNRAATLLLLH